MTPVEQVVCGALAEQLERDPGDVHPAQRLRDDLGADSVLVLAVLEVLQEHYDIRVDLRTLARHARAREIRTVGDLCAVVDDFLAGRLGGGADPG